MRLLLVEDDQNLSDAIAEQLQKEGYITDCCYDGETALHYALNPEYGYDIVLLDRMLPIIDGLTVLKAMRQKQIFTPVLILTGLGELEDKIEGLDCGADDYLVKPFHIRELLARIRALTRRPVEIQERKTITAYGLVLDAEYRRLTYQGREIPSAGRNSYYGCPGWHFDQFHSCPGEWSWNRRYNHAGNRNRRYRLRRDYRYFLFRYGAQTGGQCGSNIPD